MLRIEFLVFTLSEVFRATLVDGGKMVELVVSIRILDINNNVRKKVYESIVAHNRILFPRNKVQYLTMIYPRSMNFHKKRKSMKSCKLLRNDINVLFVLLTYFRERVSLVEKEKELRRPRKFVYVNLALETRVDGVTDSCKRR